MVAPVVGDTNLFIQRCCIISPATLIHTPVQIIARSLGSLASRNIFSSIPFSEKNSESMPISIAPIKSETIDNISNSTDSTIVDMYFLIKHTSDIVSFN